ncbi:hypothetical protein [Bradyrhizobium acaciae]|uniref:hypothetical protein n=1 Tax=Bradyrhizobium acaciae TaxID=2683706 RepID=UPI001E2AD95E|nr:hypothetical protein [Bradyrhizobium acaciae]MCC8978879.1 hypothetical protein [Bradyrhizobium acaciae]
MLSHQQMDELRASIRQLIADMPAYISDGRIDRNRWETVVRSVAKVPDDKPLNPERKGLWYRLFGFGDQSNATKYLGGKTTRATKPIGDAHLRAIYETFAALRVGRTTTHPNSPRSWKAWIDQLLDPLRPFQSNEAIRSVLRKAAATHELQMNLSKRGVACVVARDPADLRQFGADLNLFLPQQICVRIDQDRIVPPHPDRREIGSLCAYILSAVARAATSARAPAGAEFAGEYAEFYRKWKGRLLLKGNFNGTANLGEKTFAQAIHPGLRWPAFRKAVADFGSELDDIPFLHDLGRLVRLGADGILITLYDGFDLVQCDPLFRALFVRESENDAGPLLLIASKSVGVASFVPHCCELDARSFIAALTDARSKSKVASPVSSAEERDESDSSDHFVRAQLHEDRFFASREEEFDWGDNRYIPSVLEGIWRVIQHDESAHVFRLSVVRVKFTTDLLATNRYGSFEWFCHADYDPRRPKTRPIAGTAIMSGRVLQFATADGRIIMRWEVAVLDRVPTADILGHARQFQNEKPYTCALRAQKLPEPIFANTLKTVLRMHCRDVPVQKAPEKFYPPRPWQRMILSDVVVAGQEQIPAPRQAAPKKPRPKKVREK